MRRLLLTVLIAPQLVAEILHVPRQFPMIQTAVMAAADGDEIVVAPGTYYEAVRMFGKKITLRSSGGPEVTILDGSRYDASILLAYEGESLETVVQGFTFRNGRGISGIFWNSCSLPGRLGGAIFIRRSGMTIVDCVFEDNDATGGGAIFACQSDLVITRGTFLRNTAVHGGAVYHNAFSRLTSLRVKIESSRFEENHGTFGGAVFAQMTGTSSLTLSDGVFERNVGLHGGALMLFAIHKATASIEASTFHKGVSGFGGGANLRTSDDGRIAVNDSHFTENEASFGGGAFVMSAMAEGGGSQVEIANSRFIGNVVQAREGVGIVGTVCQRDGLENGQYFGGGLDLRTIEKASIVVSNSLIARNSAVRGGGAAATSCGHGGIITLLNCTIVDNQSGDGVELHSLPVPQRPGIGQHRVINSIVRGNAGRQIVEPHPSGTVSFSNVELGYAGAGNIDASPWFVDLLNGDYRLAAGSPGIDAGDNDAFLAVAASNGKDLSGAPRFADDPAVADTGRGEGRIIDLGAYEYQPPVPATTPRRLFKP